MGQKFCPAKLECLDEDGLPPNRSGAKNPKPGVLIRESLDGAVKRQTSKGRSRGGSRKK